MYNGTTYYWRGAATTNHVIFANKCWRIVRINGDKTIRLIYNGTIHSGNTCIGNGANSDAVIFPNSDNLDTSINLNRYATSDRKVINASYVGWTYSLGSQRTLSGTNSNAKGQTESWYSNNITGTNADKVADGKFCNDREVGVPTARWNWSSSDYVTSWSEYQINTNKNFAYAGVNRLLNENNGNYNPTFSCTNISDIYTLKVGAITADEVMFAGGEYYESDEGNNNSTYYLYTFQNYWTMSPLWCNGGYALMFIVHSDGYLYTETVDWVNGGLRPVINLKADITFSSGNGLKDSPYVVS